MADEKDNQHQEERNGHSFEERHADDLSAGRYARKKLWGIGTLALAIGAGIFGGLQWRKWKPEWFERLLGEDETTQKIVAGGIGASVASAIHGVFDAYDHWKKEEATKIGIREVNDDITNILTIREKTNPELIKENDTLRQMYEAAQEQNAPREAALKTNHPAAKETPGKIMTIAGHERASLSEQTEASLHTQRV